MLSLQSRARGDKADHYWELRLHADGCHFYTSTYYCTDCGAWLKVYGERDFNGDPWSAIWMEPHAYEGEDDWCPRCAEIRDGSEPVYYTEISR